MRRISDQVSDFPCSHAVPIMRRGLTGGRGFTLIEVLVVVAIIALLISILLPSLARAKEQSKATVCLSNLKQQGVGFSTYAVDNTARLPMSGKWQRYTLMEGVNGQGGDHYIRTNQGALYPRYVGQTLHLFYCPSDKKYDVYYPRSKSMFMSRYLHPWDATGANTTSDPKNFPIMNYNYALPVAGGKSPLDAGRNMYPADSMTHPDGSFSPYYQYVTDKADQTPELAASFLGPFPPGARGKYNVLALTTDAYFGGFKGYHIDGLNVLYSDFHARRVPDPKKRLQNDIGGELSYTAGSIASGGGRAFIAWDYLSKQH
jgi:prepilin-type N-terminal cleavage/methylation domain-containing protein